MLKAKVETNPIAKNLNPVRNLKWLTLLVCLLLGLVVGLRLLAFFQISIGWLNYPFWRPGSEGLVLDETLRVRHNLPIYGPITPTSFISGPYPPVFYYLSAWLMNFVGEGLLAGRLIALGSAVACAALVSGLVWQGSCSWWAALLFGPLLLLTAPFLIWASRDRGDILMVAFGLAGLLLVSLRGQISPSFWVGGSLILFGLAFYTKQTGLAAPLTAFVWLTAQNWRTGLKYGAGLVAVIIAPFLMLEIVTNHEFYRHIISYHALPWDWASFGHWLGVFTGDNWVLVSLTIALILLNGGWWVSRWRNGEVLSGLKNIPLVVWFGLFGIANLVTTGVEGADHNHLLLPIAAVCTSSGVGFGLGLKGDIAHLGWLQKTGLQIVSTILALVLAAQLGLGWDALVQNYSFDLMTKLSPAEQNQMSKIVAYVKTVKGPILSEEVALPALAAQENQVQYNDVYTMGLLAAAGKWNAEGLAQQVRQKYFALILVPFDLESQRSANHKIWPPDVLQAIKDNYQIKFRDVWFMYVPK